jgi:hypothetical protein
MVAAAAGVLASSAAVAGAAAQDGSNGCTGSKVIDG